MTASPTPKGAERASLIEKSTASILEAVAQNEGISANGLSTKVGINYTLCHGICRDLVAEGRLEREGTGKHHRYYTPGHSPTSMKRDDPAPVPETRTGKEKRKDTRNTVAKEVAKAVRNPGPSIPADLKAYTPMEAAPETPGTVPEAKDTKKVVFAPSERSEIGKALADERRASAPVTAPTPAPAEAQDVPDDIDALFAQLTAIRAVPRSGTSADAMLDSMTETIETSIRSSLRECPHCGKAVKLVEKDGRHSVYCDCGAQFVYARDPTSLKCTIKAFNRRP